MALTTKQLAAIPALIGSDTVEGAARAAKISKNTLYTWMQQEEFSKAVSSERKKLLDKAMHKLMSVSMKAVITLEKLLDAESEAVRRAAANDVLGHVLKYRELEERIIVISHPKDEQEFERLKAEKIEKLRERYGEAVSEDHLTILCLRYEKKHTEEERQ